MKPPPPILPAVGWVTASAKAVATAPSTALPPSRITFQPTSEAMSLCDTTIARRARAGWLPASRRDRDGGEDERDHGRDETAGMHSDDS